MENSDELKLIRRLGPADEVGVVDLVLRESQVVIEGAGVKKPVVVVVADRAYQDATPPRKHMPRTGRLPYTVHHR